MKYIMRIEDQRDLPIGPKILYSGILEGIPVESSGNCQIRKRTNLVVAEGALGTETYLDWLKRKFALGPTCCDKESAFGAKGLQRDLQPLGGLEADPMEQEGCGIERDMVLYRL